MSEDSTAKEINRTLDTLERSLSELNSHLQPLLKKPLDELLPKLQPLEKAKLEVLLCYASNTLFHMYLTTQGASPNEHPVKQELDRIRGYIKKVKDVETSKSAPESARIDVEAAHRFISRSLASDPSEVPSYSSKSTVSESNDRTALASPDTPKTHKKEKHRHSHAMKKERHRHSHETKSSDITNSSHHAKIDKHSKKHKHSKNTRD